MKRLALLLALASALIGAAVFSFRVWPRETPAGQPPLQRLSSLDPLRAAFNEGHGEYRVLALLSPTCGVCVNGAAALGQLVGSLPSGRARTLVVWMPVIRTDLGPPTNTTLALISDPVARQYWDPDHLVSTAVLEVAQRHPDRLSPEDRDRLADTPVAWDVVALFDPSATWDAELPWPSYWGGPVVRAIDDARVRLSQTTGSWR
jgi:hypothetical protein